MSKLADRVRRPNATYRDRLIEHVRERYHQPMVNTPFRLTKTGVPPRK